MPVFLPEAGLSGTGTDPLSTFDSADDDEMTRTFLWEWR
jgi:hypothetical protein